MMPASLDRHGVLAPRGRIIHPKDHRPTRSWPAL